MSVMNDVTLTLTPRALETLGAIQRRVGLIGEYERGSDHHLAALESLVQSLIAMLRLGGRISQDSELSLLGLSWIEYGVIGHATYVNGERSDLYVTWSVHS